MRIFKISIKFNTLFTNRGGRFLSIYDTKGNRINGKILKTRFLVAKFQDARTKETYWIKNWKASVLVADHQVHF